MTATHLASAAPVLLEPLRAAMEEQLTAATSNVPVDRQAVAALKRGLAAVDKPTVNGTLKETQVLSLVLNALGRTSLADQFSGVASDTVQNYEQALSDWADRSADTLASTPASAVHQAAEKSLNACRALLGKVDLAEDLTTASKFLAQTAAKLVGTDRLISRAAKAHSPPVRPDGTASVSAQMRGDINWDFRSSQGAIVSTNAGLVSGYLVFGAQVVGGSKRAVVLAFSGLQPGQNELSLGIGPRPGTFAGIAEEVNGDTTSWASQSGSATVTYDPQRHTLQGTFSFECANGQDHTRTVTMSGSFSASVK